MTVKPSSLPEGLYQIRFSSSGHEYVVVLRDGRLYGPTDFNERSPEQWTNLFDTPDFATPLIPAPDGMTMSDAQHALTEASRSHPSAGVVVSDGAIVLTREQARFVLGALANDMTDERSSKRRMKRASQLFSVLVKAVLA